jgi:protein-L-isoaspartate(D-aspartate) O-methyltransferase
LRAVPRHAFVPEAPLADAYANATVDIKYDTDGVSVSCASQPDIVALMLDQLQAQPGERILEQGPARTSSDTTAGAEAPPGRPLDHDEP